MSEDTAEHDFGSWGRTALEQYLGYAIANPEVHGQALVKMVEEKLPSEMTADLEGLDPSQKAAALYERINSFPQPVLKEIGRQALSNSVFNRVSFSLEEYCSQRLPKGQQVLQRALSEKEGIEGVELVFYSDTQEKTFVKKGGEWFVASLIRTSLSSDHLEARLSLLPNCVPPAEVSSIENNGDRQVLVLVKKVEGSQEAEAVGTEEVIEAARKMAEVGFVADLNLGNFIKDKEGSIWYVDGDIFDYLLGSPELDSAVEVAAAVDREIARFKSSQIDVDIKKGLFRG